VYEKIVQLELIALQNKESKSVTDNLSITENKQPTH